MDTNQESFDVRIPERYLDVLHEGEITASMYLAISVLYKWANWNTGKVKQCSAGGLRTWTCKAYSEKTFSEALRRWELMGEITRHTVPGSHKDYPVTLHNYKKYDDAGKVTILNPKKTKLWSEIQRARCDEASEEASYETSHEGSEETSEKVLSETLSQKPVLNPVSNPEVSQLAGQFAAGDSSLRSSPPTIDINGGLAEQRCKELHAWRDESDANARWLASLEIGLQTVFGFPYVTVEHAPHIMDIVEINRLYEWNAKYVTDMAAWARDHKFWRNRVVDLRTFAKALGNQDEKGLPAQYRSHVNALARKETKVKKRDAYHSSDQDWLGGTADKRYQTGGEPFLGEPGTVGKGFDIEEDAV